MYRRLRCCAVMGRPDSCGVSHADYQIPSALDWMSIDMYHMSGPAQGWVDTFPRTFYQKYIYPNLTASQHVLLVPGSFGSNVNRDCDNACYDIMCAQDASEFWAWAQQDDRVAAIAPW